MPSATQAYNALPSETTSISRSLSQQDTCSQLDHDKPDPPKVPPHTKILRSAYISHLWMSWKWETAACVLLLAMPIITFSTIYPHNGQPLPQWPFKVSINSLLSVYALIFKAIIGFILTSCIGQLQWAWFSETRPLTDLLHFDGATRGADGALGLIWRQRFRQPLTALGCIIMVLVVTVDPFVQQLARPVDCSVEHSGGNGAATLPRANVFIPQYYGGSVNSSALKLDSDFFLRMPKELEYVLQEAMYSPGRNPPWQCSTGNCTFPETYGTIGICYSCEDTSMDVTLNATCSYTNSYFESHHPKSSADCPKGSEFTVATEFTDGNDIVLATKMGLDQSGIVLAGAHSAMALDKDGGTDYLGSGLYVRFLLGASANTGGRIDWTTSGIDHSTCDSREPATSWSCQGYGAATCFLHPCVQTYNATVTAGSLAERLVGSSLDTPWGILRDQDGNEYLALIDTYCSQIQIPTNTNASMKSRWLPYNLDLWTPTNSDATAELPLPGDATFLLENGCIYVTDMYSTLGSVGNDLNGTIEAGSMDIDRNFYEGHGKFRPRITSLGSFEGPELIRGIYNWGHTDLNRVQSIISNISHSLTTYIRTNGGSGRLSGSRNYSRDVQGVAYHYATCLEVQWPWLAFPACLAILTALFFLTVVGTTTRHGTSIWKASPLAWILRAEGLGDELCTSGDGSREDMEKRSTQIAVHLSDEDSGGLRIRMADLKDPNML